MKHKSLFFIIPITILVWIFLVLIPYNNLFSFEEQNQIVEENKILTNYSLEEIKEINKILEKIDEKNILEESLKNELLSLKNNFKKEEENKILAEKLKEQIKKEISTEMFENISWSWIFEKIKETWTWILSLNKNLEKVENLENKTSKILDKKEEKLEFKKELDISKNFAKLHIQERNQSCESAATADILSTMFKKDFSEKEILDKMPKDKTYGKPSYIKDGKIIWWDPNVWFVWDMDLHQFNLTGYAIYEKPMSKIYEDLWVKFDLYNRFENNLGLKNPKEALVYMLKEIHKWNFVQTWWEYCTDQRFEDWTVRENITTQQANSWISRKNFCYSFDEERRITWYTEEWKQIDAVKQSHNFILLGYIWDIENPEKIIVWDTYTWKHIYPTAEWMRKWELNDARAIIIYNEKK